MPRFRLGGIAAYPILIVWWGLSHVEGPIGEMLRAPLVVNAVAVYNSNAVLGVTWQVTTLATIFVVTIAASVFLWQRAEVLN